MEHKDKTRRVHDAEFKAKVLGECRQPGASIAAVALRHGLNANVVRQWLAGRGVKRAGLLGSGCKVPTAASAPMATGNPAPVVDAQFVALALPAPDKPRPSAEGPAMANPSTPDIHIEWRSGAWGPRSSGTATRVKRPSEVAKNAERRRAASGYPYLAA